MFVFIEGTFHPDFKYSHKLTAFLTFCVFFGPVFLSCLRASVNKSKSKLLCIEWFLPLKHHILQSKKYEQTEISNVLSLSIHTLFGERMMLF